MKILLTGGGTGGHFYPIIAVAQELNDIAKENRLVKPILFFMSTGPYNEGLLFENNITFVPISSGKIRGYKSPINFLLNFIDLFRIGWGSLKALWKLFVMYPDVVFGKGGYTSFPAILAARILRIPVVIHESDSIPGKVNGWAGRFAARVAISYPDAVVYFKKAKEENRVAYTGNPIRREIVEPLVTGSHKLLELDPNVKTILILGGSQGARFINEVVLSSLPELLKKYQVVHQTGKNNIKVVEETSNVVLQESEYKNRYKPFDYLDVLHERSAAGIADIVVSRAGSTIFEIASWKKPSIIVPIPEPTSHDQRSNAYAYARSGACIVVEEKNFSPHVLVSEATRLLESPELKEKMSKAAATFARRDAAKLIAQEIIAIGLSHEK